MRKMVGIIGYPLGHSISPAMHNAAFKKLDLDFEYLPFEIKEKEFVLIAGRSGAGKTTVIKMLTGEEKPTKGRVFFSFEEPVSSDGIWQTTDADEGTYIFTVTASDGKENKTSHERDQKTLVKSLGFEN